MANLINLTDGTATVWADTTDYSSTVSGLARTDQIDLTSVADAASRQGAKGDLGVDRANRYKVLVALEYAVAPASQTVASIYWASSPSGTAGNANPGGTSGSDAAYTGTAGDSLTDSLLQLEFIGNVILTADATTVVQYQEVGILENPARYGMPVVVNSGGQALVSDAVEQYVALLPMLDEIQ